MQTLTPAQLASWLNDPQRSPPALLDVREPWEFELCHIPGSRLVPMATVPARVAELDADQPWVVICHHGARSAQVTYFLMQQGFGQVFNLSGGVAAWAAAVDPSMPQY
jgi:rhodanese-related sulfurtransferase